MHVITFSSIFPIVIIAIIEKGERIRKHIEGTSQFKLMIVLKYFALIASKIKDINYCSVSTVIWTISAYGNHLNDFFTILQW